MVFRPTLIVALWLALLATGLLGIGGSAHGAASAADLEAAETAFRTGEYAEAARLATDAIAEGTWNDSWHRLLIETQMTTGDYAAALATYEQATQRFSTSLPLRIQGVDVLRYNGLAERAMIEQGVIFEMLSRSPARYSGSENLIAAGQYFASRGEDARKILELFYDRVRKTNPGYTTAYVATAELALSKHDYSVAADALQQAAKLDPADPEIAYLAAEAWMPSDAERATAELNRALELNPKHLPSLLMQADQLVDRESYDQAQEVLSAVEAVNAQHPLLWAYRAVLAHVRGDWEGEADARERALKPWPENPEVDYVIGRELSQKYRFAEGAAAQRRALDFDPGYAESRFQLAQDLLRLGEDETGWELAEWAHEEDGYNVVAFNLMTLRDRLQAFTILKRDNLLVRMQAHEAEVYGDAVLDLLAEAEQALCDKYDVSPDGPIVVEIFPNQQDFAIRTFGLPGGDGFLGVCFGRVITANSPASQGADPSNWQSVLWHEFCHVVTLSKTNNRMPRWLSEGISVYEERQRDPTWGQQMTPTFRKMILGQDLTPISQLSGAFLTPKSPMHLQLAYYESSLAVEFIVEKYGLDVLRKILVDLGVGMPINETLQRYAGSLSELDEGFTTFARGQAQAFGSAFDWSEEEMPESADPDQWRTWLESHPDNYWGLQGLAAALIGAGEFEAAKQPLEQILDLAGDDSDTSALAMLASVHRALDETAQERERLEHVVATSADGFQSLVRLMELQAADEDWQAVAASARKALQINPLLPVAHRRLAEALEHTGSIEQAVRPLRVLATMDPVDPAGLHFRTARALLASGDDEAAKRATVMALEQAPHYREAQQMLLRLSGSDSPPQPETTQPETTQPETTQPESGEAKTDDAPTPTPATAS